MKQIIFALITTLFLTTAQSQVIQSRRLDVDPADVAKFEAAVAKKNQMYNSKDDQARWITFQIMTGPYAYNYIRTQVAESMSEFDVLDKAGNDFWQKTVGPLHTSVGNRIWAVNTEMTYNPTVSKQVNHRRIIYYNVKDDKLNDFWRYRERAKKIWEEMEMENRVGVMTCLSGCDGNWVQVRFHHKDFTNEEEAWENMPAFAEAYNGLFGEGSYKEDLERLRNSLMPNGRRIRHHKRLPELSSSWR